MLKYKLSWLITLVYALRSNQIGVFLILIIYHINAFDCHYLKFSKHFADRMKCVIPVMAIEGTSVNGSLKLYTTEKGSLPRIR